ncbi:MAG: FtsH protease activity modulator HflK [Parvibaculum sp.]|uniref:FtsH protease activity modulator HflK n=1 Tax=Parvibaculum sp. TaxID=2024848 RepID=UPI0032EBB4C4
MPWSNQNGGGGWQGGGGGGGGNRGPWGQGPSGGGNQPPDLDELIRRAQEKFRQMFPGGGGGGAGTGTGAGGGSGPFILIGLVILGLIAYSSFFRVNVNEQGIVLRFGKLVRTVEPDLHMKFPFPIETVYTPAVTNITTVDIGMRLAGSSPIAVPEESLMLTGDENIVDIGFAVQWRINSAHSFLFNVEDPDRAVKAVAESMMREAVGQSRIEVLQTVGRNEVQNQVRTGLQATLDSYGAGIEITEVRLQKVDPPAQVLDAFRDVQAARADQERLRNQAETYANTVIPRARGDAAQITQAAEAYREQIVAEAQGEAGRFVSIYEEYRKATDVTRRRIYLETMQEVLGGMNKVLMDGAQGGQNVLPYLPLNELKPKAPASGTTTSGSNAATGGSR